MQQGITTRKGLDFILSGLSAEGVTINKVMLGDGVVETQNEAMSMTTLKSPKKTIQLNPKNVKVLKNNQNKNTGVAEIKIPISNEDVETGFFIREIGIFAEHPVDGEFLYSITLGGENPIFLEPKMSTSTGDLETLSLTLEVQILIGNAPTVEVYLSNNLTYVTWADLEEHAGELRTNQTIYDNWRLIKDLELRVSMQAIIGNTGNDENTMIIGGLSFEGVDKVWGIHDINMGRLIG